MIMIRNKQTRQCSGDFFNKTCAYMHLKAMNSLADNEIVKVNYYLMRPLTSKEEQKIGPFDNQESLFHYQSINRNKSKDMIRLKTIIIL